MVITIANNKGGAGKTATAVNMAAALRLRGFDVLLMDCDGQANATISLQIPTTGNTIYDAMRDTSTNLQPVRAMGATSGAGVLDAIPSCPDLSAIETELAQANDRVTRLGRIVEPYRDKYDVIIIDTPPTLGILTISALYAADNVIIPTQPHYLAVRGLLALTEAINTVNGYRNNTPLTPRVLFTQYDKRKGLHRMTVEQVQGAGYKVFGTLIRDNVALAECPAIGVDIFRYAPKSRGAQDYDALAAEYVKITKIRHKRRK